MRLTLSPESVTDLHTACVAAPGLETGGLLIGTRHECEAHVWAVTGPGPAAVLETRRMAMDTGYMLGVIAGVSVAGVVEVLGRWHKHLAPDLRASDSDRRGAEAFRRLVSPMGDSLELIVGTDDDAPIGYGAYTCGDHGLRRIACPTSPRQDGNSAHAADCPSRPALTTTSSRSSSTGTGGCST